MSEGPASWDQLEASLKRSFADGVRWPIDRAALAALIDIGLSNAQIADYFSVARDDVHVLRARYRLVAASRT